MLLNLITSFLIINIFLLITLAVLPYLNGLIGYKLGIFIKALSFSCFNFKIQYWFNSAGIVVHEIGHLLSNLIFAHEIKGFKLLNYKKMRSNWLGFVNANYNLDSKYQVLGNFYIGLAPIYFGVLVFGLIFKLLTQLSFDLVPAFVGDDWSLNFRNVSFKIVGLTFSWLHEIITAFTDSNLLVKLIILILIGLISASVFGLSKSDLKIVNKGFKTLLGTITFASFILAFLGLFLGNLGLFINKCLIILVSLSIMILVLTFICMLVACVLIITLHSLFRLFKQTKIREAI